MIKNVTPESCGISSRYVERFINTLQKRNLHMHSVMLCRGTNAFLECYWAPYNKDSLHRMYSQTKSYVSVAIGLLIDEGKLSLDDKIVSFFPEKIDTPLDNSLKNQTIRDMLTMSTVGVGEFWFDYENVDRLRLYFNREGKLRSPGTIWEYDSQGSQVLACLVEKLSGTTLFDYLNKKVFSHLGAFKNATILKTPTGDSWGDSALLCTLGDMVSFARFVMNYGVWDGRVLLSSDYLKEATSRVRANKDSAHDDVLCHGYGYQIWRTEKNGFAFVGMGNQLTVCLPDYDLIFSCTADNQGSTYSTELILSSLFDIIVENLQSEKLCEDEISYQSLKNATQGLTLYALKGEKTSPIQNEINGAKYEFYENELGLKDLIVNFNGDGGELIYTNKNGKMHLPFLFSKNYFGLFPEFGYSQDAGGVVTTDGSQYKCATSGAWLDGRTLAVFSQIIDRYLGNVYLSIAFNGDNVTVSSSKFAENFLHNYSGIAIGYKSKE